MNIRHLTRRLVCPLVAAASGLLFATVATACPSCKEAISEGGGDLISGYFWSILFMMSMPFVLLSAFCGSMYLAVRRARSAAAARQELPALAQPQPAARQRELVEV
jgi:hypothetical protein